MNPLGRTAVFEDQRDGLLGNRGRRRLCLGRGRLGPIRPWRIGPGRRRAILIIGTLFIGPIVWSRLRGCII
jgi:hypothetical protein